MDTSTAGFGFDLGIEAETSVSIEDESVASFEGRLPSLIKIFWNVNDDTKRYREFFRENRGALAITEAQCITHKVCISIHNCLANYVLDELYIYSLYCLYSNKHGYTTLG